MKIQIESKFKSLMEVWIEDLRTNPYLQGEDYLYSNGRYCCLGRLCVVTGEFSSKDLEDLYFPLEAENAEDYIPQTLLEDSLDSVSMLLCKMNDGFGNKNIADKNIAKKFEIECRKYSFPEIANFLEERIEYI